MRQTNSNAIFDRLPNKFEVKNAKQLRELSSSRSDKAANAEFSLVLGENNPISIPILPSLTETLLEFINHVADGRGLSVIPLNSELTAQRIAAILNVSKEYVIKLLENKELPFVKKGRHRLIRTGDVFNYKERRDAIRKKSLCELAELDSGLI